MVDETIPEKCETLYNKLNSFVESEISRDVTPQISNLNSRINALEPNLVRVKEVNGNTSSISAGGTSTKTFTVPACPSGYNWKYLSTSTGWGTVSSASLSGTTLTVTLLNVSNTSHDISFSGVLMYYPKTIEAEPHIQLTATNPYLLSGEVTDLVVSLIDEFGLPLSNKTVTISDGTSSYNGITNTNGLFTLSDVEVTDSITMFTASYGSATDVVLVYNCLFVDYGVSSNYNTNWEKGDNVALVRDENYTTVSNSSGSASALYKPDNWALYSGDIAIEWDNWATTCQLNYFIVTGSTDTAKTFGALYINKPCKVKITIIGTTMKCYIDGVDKATYTINRDNNDKVKVRLQINSGGDNIKYSNFRIYSID